MIPLPENVKENSNWVKRRANCSADKVFRELEIDVRADVEARNAVRDQDLIEFEFQSNGKGEFTVFRGDVGQSSVRFRREVDVIWVEDNRVSFSATVNLSDEGDCRFMVDGKELESWQFRKRALETIFFRNG